MISITTLTQGNRIHGTVAIQVAVTDQSTDISI